MDRFQEVLQQYWHYDDFRGIQREIIDSVASGRDTLGLMPTGGGKSITFQVPALVMDGVCLVITPLIALMKDQVINLVKRGITARAIYNGMSHDRVVQTLDNTIYGGVKILYVSPERLSSELFLVKVGHMNISLITVDEAHCISQWGYDFRPAYLEIAKIREIHPGVPVLALTATATEKVVGDIQKHLCFAKENVFRMSFERKNLSYVIRRSQDKIGQMVHILNSVPGSAIVYVHTRKHSKEISDVLNEAGISSTYYHAGLDDSEKDLRQKQWQNDDIRVIVATNAFGMGIDKPEVRLVIHYDSPDSIEAYFQEAGRAGRDGLKSYAVMLYNGNDHHVLMKRIPDNFPEKDYVRKVYEHLACYFQIAVDDGEDSIHELNMDKFCHTFKHFPVRVESSLKILQRAGYLDYDVDFNNKSRFRFTVEKDQLYKLDTESDMCNDVIMMLLRNYGGLFSEFQYIEESYIAHKLNLQDHQVYLLLKYLNDINVATYIPRRSTPYIIYTRDRVDTEDIIIDREAYDDRKTEYERRIKSMIEYLENEDVCRSRFLLDYFGERNEYDCGICDVCLK